jgi:TonB-linked SusC/RagA family outer membrane protein
MENIQRKMKGKIPLLNKTMLVVKITTILLLATFLNVFAEGFTQQRVTLSLESADLRTVLTQIEKKTKYRFLYNQSILNKTGKITVRANNEYVPSLLDKIFEGSLINYKIMNENLVVLSEGIEEGPMPQEVKGKVLDAAGKPIAGASITVKGTKTGTAADAEGNFSITVPDNAVLIISAVGYSAQEVVVGSQTSIEVSMVSAAGGGLNDVVVIGYGTASKRDLTGSIVKLSGKEVVDRPNPNPVASLQGKVAGMSVVNSGQPGQEPDIRIRGTISRYQTKPLYVVDGILNDNINFLNPSDIESIEVLKDPSSLAIFGVRGANGVIAVTTKKGRAGKTQVSFNTSFGIKNIVDRPALTDATQFKTLYDEQRVNQGAAPFQFYDRFQGNTDWVSEIANENAMVSVNNISVSSGNETNKVYMGIGYIREEGLIKHEKLEKIMIDFSDELRLSKSFKVGINFNGYKGWMPQLRDFSSSLNATPIVEPFNTTEGLYNQLPDEIGGPQIANPLLIVDGAQRTQLNNEYRIVGSVFGDLTVAKHFNFRATFYGDFGFNNGRSYTPQLTVYAADRNVTTLQGGFDRTRVSQFENHYNKYQQDYILSYKNNFGDHSLNLTGGFTTYYDGFSGISGQVNQFATGEPIPNDKRWWYLNVFPFGDPTSRTSNSSQWERTTASYLVRALYNYQGKYLLNASFRRDGSSEISPENRFQNFYAFGAAWEVSKEDFMQSQNIFDYMKVKGSYGKLGNQYTGINYPYYPNYIQGQTAVFGENIVPAFQLAYLSNPNLAWETVTSWEAGIELASFNNRLRFEATYFDKLTDNLLTFIPSSNSLDGYTNAGQISNKGWEFSATWGEKLKSGFEYSLSGNLTTFKNRVEEIYQEGYEIIEGSSRTTAGFPIGYFYGYTVEGVYQSYNDKLGSPNAAALGAYGPGDLKYKDINNDGRVDVNDRGMIGNPTPDFIYGISGTMAYKGFDVGLEFQGVYGNEVYRDWGNGNSFAPFNYRTARLNRWTGPGTSNWEPRVTDLASINREASTYMIEDGSYFRLRNLQFGYTFKIEALAKANISSLRLFYNGQNLKTWTDVSGFTPEAGGSAIRFGVDGGGYPIPAIHTFGLNVTF